MTTIPSRADILRKRLLIQRDAAKIVNDPILVREARARIDDDLDTLDDAVEAALFDVERGRG